jgi:hypothetical protein
MIVSGYEIFKGKKLPDNEYPTNSFFQPLQFLPSKLKDASWCAQQLNYVDWQSLIQLRKNANWMLKNYKMAIGEIEKSDYIEQNSEYADVIGTLDKRAGGILESMEIKNYPFAHTVVNILDDEFSKRVSHMSFADKSEAWANSMLEQKRADVEQSLEQKAYINQMIAMQKLGLSPDSKEGQQMIDPETIKSLPEIQNYYNKSYRDIYQQWAEKQMVYDNERFYMPELERVQFRNMLITDREVWHFRMMENDYDIQVWNPPQVAYRKSPSTRYLSDAAWICYVDYLTVPDCIDRHGWKMSEEQLLSLNTIHGARSATYALDGKEPDQYWRGDQTYEWNRTGPGIGMRQALSVLDNVSGAGGDIARAILNEGEDVVNINGEFMVRESTIYWKSERKFYALTKIDEQGNQIRDIVGEDYKITTKPMYNTVLYPDKCKETLIYGEHLDPLWANETWGGIRIGTNVPSIGWQGTSATFAPIYLGVAGPVPGRLPFQFKGDKDIYGCKLPVEGRVYNDHNTKSRAFIDNLKTWQVILNMTGNLIQDTMINDLGVIAAIDPSALPKHSIGDDWGPNLWAAGLTAMKTTNSIPLNSAGIGTDGQRIGRDPLHRVDLSQTERLLGLMKIFDWAKAQGLDSVGLNPRRTGTPIGQESTATEVKQDMASSYSHTEYLFTQHSDDVMPRVHQMRTDLAQYYHSTNPSVRLQYLTSADEQAMFEIDGTELLGRSYSCKSTTTVNARAIMGKIEQMLMTDNTSGADVYDKIKAVQTPTLSSLNQVVTQLQKKKEQEQQQSAKAEQDAAKAEQDHQMQLLQEKQQFEAEQNDKDRQSKEYIADQMAAARAAGANPPQAGEDAYQNATKLEQQQQQHTDKMDLAREKEQNHSVLEKEKLNLGRQKVQEESKRTAGEIKVAKINHKVQEKNKLKK